MRRFHGVWLWQDLCICAIPFNIGWFGFRLCHIFTTRIWSHGWKLMVEFGVVAMGLMFSEGFGVWLLNSQVVKKVIVAK